MALNVVSAVDGDTNGLEADGSLVGALVGVDVVNALVGDEDGSMVGGPVGVCTSSTVGVSVGFLVGIDVGFSVDVLVGKFVEDSDDGDAVADAVGEVDGDRRTGRTDGASVGAGTSTSPITKVVDSDCWKFPPPETRILSSFPLLSTVTTLYFPSEPRPSPYPPTSSITNS